MALAGEVYSFTGGAPGNSGFAVRPWDKAARRTIPVDALFSDWPRARQLIAPACCAALAKAQLRRRAGKPLGNDFDACPKLSEQPMLPLGGAFARRAGRFRVPMAPCVAGSYPEGSYLVTAPWPDAVQSMVKPAYRGDLFEDDRQVAAPDPSPVASRTSISGGMSETLYNTRILRLAAATADLARLAAPQGSAVKVSPVCGSKVTADIDLDAAGLIARHGQEVRACALGQAAAVLVGAEIVGRPPAGLVTARAELADWLAGRSDVEPAWPGMTVFAPARPHRARHASILLAFDAAIAAAQQAAA